MRQPGSNQDGGSPLSLALAESGRIARHVVLVAAPMGMLVGTAIAAYDFTINEVLWKHVLSQPAWVRFWAPLLAMTLAGALLRLFRVSSSSMADEVVNAYHAPGAAMPAKTAWGKLLASIATMGLGASAGMEGASKWLGATIGSLLQTLLNRTGLRALAYDVKTTLISGGSAGIAAIFRAPLSGAIMGVESPYKHDLAHEALLHALVASATSFWAYTRLRPATPYFPVTFHYVLTTRDLLVAIPLGLVAGAASHLFLGTLRAVRARFERAPAPLVVRMAAAGLVLVGLAYAGRALVGEPVTLQAGLPVANKLLAGHFVLQAAVLVFVLKLAATAITFGGGGVGGLFVPTATIGAAVGACFDQLFAASHPGVFTLLGIAAFAGASYNSILFSAVFVAEATGNVFLVVPALVATTLAFLVSAGVSNSRSQIARRAGWREQLARLSISSIMTEQLVTAVPGQTLEAFGHSVLAGHHFKALPVIGENGALAGLVSVAHLRGVPHESWPQVTVREVMDPRPPVLRPEDAVAAAEVLLRQPGCDYVPVVDASGRLVGIVSHSDIYRAVEPRPEAEPAAPSR